MARSRHLLRLVLHSSGISPRQSRRFDQTSHRRVDDSDGSQRRRRGFLIPPWHALPSSRSGYKILHCVSGCPAVQRNTAISPSAAEFESERFLRARVSSVPQECLSKLSLFGEASLRRALTEYIEHHHFERDHQGKGNL